MIKTCGIYKIVNSINNKLYIGQSVEIEKRWNRHKNELNKGIHKNEHLQRAWSKYGNKYFKFEIIEKCQEDELNEKEVYWIAFYKSNNYEKGYNLDSGGVEGKKLNEDVRKRIGNSRIYPVGENCSNALLTNTQIIEIRKLISEDKLTLTEIGKMYNVGKHVIYRIKKFESYNEIVTIYDNIIKNLPHKVKRGNGKQKLNEETVLEIKKLLAENKMTRVKIAEMFGVQRGTIRSIKSLETWAEVGIEYNEIIKNQNNREKLMKEDVVEIKRMINNGLTNAEIALKFNIDASCISNIRTGKAWKQVEFNNK